MKNILFVCVDNSCRSQIAEAYPKMLGKGVVDVFSSGSKPSGVVNPKAVQSMAEMGYDLATHQSVGLDDVPKIRFDYAITMGCGDECPMIDATNRVDWGIPDPKHMDAAECSKVRDLIGEKVRDLLHDLV